MSRDPVGGFKQMFKNLRLPFTPDCELAVRQSTGETNVKDAAAAGLPTEHTDLDTVANITNWKRRLTTEEINRVRAATEDVAWNYYADSDW